MQSTDFDGLVNAALIGARARHMATGGGVHGHGKHPINMEIVIPQTMTPAAGGAPPQAQPNPVIGALMHAMILGHIISKAAQHHHGALVHALAGGRHHS